VVLRRQPLSPGQFVDRVLDRLADRAAREAVRLANNVAPDLRVVADPVAMDAVLRNLVENAIASVAPAGGGDIEVSAALEGERVAVAVRDSGGGFEPDEADGLFEKFGKSHLACSPRERSGLGLYVVRRLMELSGGSVSAASAGKGRGATFTVRWPIATERAA
jgi:signal transduction histidine kinase